MNNSSMPHALTAGFRAAPFPTPQTVQERRPDGTLILRSAYEPVAVDQLSFSDSISGWSARRGDTPAFCERDAQRAWRSISWIDLWRQTQTVAAALLDLDLGPERPLMLLSGNSIEQAVLLLAAEYVGVPTAPVSPPYSLQSSDFARLKGVRDLVPPGAIFVQALAPFERALAALDCTGATIIAGQGARADQVSWTDMISTELTDARRAAISAAHAKRRKQDVMRVLFTSGSTGVPKGVPITYGNVQGTIANLLWNFGSLVEPHATFLDWLPWHHAFGGILNLGRSVLLGATHYVDDGRPVPGLFERTVHNLREVSPTVFNGVPSAWLMLANELERDPVLARSLFAKVVNFGYGGASLPAEVWQRIQRVADRTVGERIVFTSGLASTETAGCGTFFCWASEDVGNIGVPVPGSEIKLVPLEGGEGRHEIRVRGAHNFAGYVSRPDLTAAAFDDEGYFRLGDAVRFADPADPGQGLRFAGRVVEDFKLTNGTWVRTGAVRLALMDQCAPFLTDAVICGHDRDFVAALAWPDVAACRQLSPALAQLKVDELVRHPIVVNALRARLTDSGSGVSATVRRLMLMADPPSIDANEIADKGYVNQATVRTRRANLVEDLYRSEVPPHIANADAGVERHVTAGRGDPASGVESSSPANS